MTGIMYGRPRARFGHTRGLRDKIDVEIPKCPIFGHLLVTDAKMPHFEEKWDILASVCIFMQVAYLCPSHFRPFWQPSYKLWQ